METFKGRFLRRAKPHAGAEAPLTGTGCTAAPPPTGRPGRPGRKTSCRSVCSTQPGPRQGGASVSADAMLGPRPSFLTSVAPSHCPGPRAPRHVNPEPAVGPAWATGTQAFCGGLARGLLVPAQNPVSEQPLPVCVRGPELGPLPRSARAMARGLLSPG